MGYFDTGWISGKSRADGTTARTVTMARVGNVNNGFDLREVSPTYPGLAQTIGYRTYVQRSRSGLRIRVVTLDVRWPYDVDSAPGELAGTVVYNRTGLHIPDNCPANTRLDIWTQLISLSNNSAGSVGKMLVYDPMTTAIPAT